MSLAGARTRPHDELPLLPPEAQLETPAVLKLCIEARASLAELKQALRWIPNPGVLISALPLLEAQASSEIENVVTTADRLFEHLSAEGGADPATKEALRYRHALLEGFHSLEQRPLTTATCEAVCTRIKDVEMRVRRVPGTTLANQQTGEVIYTPPVGESRLRDLLANWERYIHDRSDVDPLVRMAVAHYQFEAIHPFTDGNGRTGRTVNLLLLVEMGLLPLPVLYLSRFIIAHRAEYYEGLLAVTREQAWESWILFMLEAVRDTAMWTTRKIESVRTLAEATTEYVRAKLPKLYSHELIELLFEQPYCRIANVVDAGIAKRQAASTYLGRLTDADVLEGRSEGRGKLFLNKRLLQLLIQDVDEFVPFPE